MNRRQLTTLILAGIVLGGLGLWAYKQRQAPYQESTRKMGDKLLPEFPLNDVAQIAIRQRDSRLHLVRQNETWTVQERGGYPANFSTISELLRKVWEVKISNPVRVGESRLPMLELVPPEQGPGTLVEFKNETGQVIQSLLLGAKHMKESRGQSQWGGGSWPDGRYVMVGNNLQSVALVSEPFSNVEPRAEDWLNKDWFKVEKLKSIAVTGTNLAANWNLSRESETNEWKLAEPQAEEQLDTSKLYSVTSALSHPSFNDVITNTAPEQTGLDNPLSARLETFEGFVYDVKVGAKNADDNYHLQVAVSASLPKERTPGPDEKDEDKERLEKEFKEQKSKLEDKLKKEKTFATWTYLVSKWTIDPLLKERKELLQEKKEEPKEEKPDEPKPDTGPTTP